jgi:hypothetical protein
MLNKLEIIFLEDIHLFPKVWKTLDETTKENEVKTTYIGKDWMLLFESRKKEEYLFEHKVGMLSSNRDIMSVIEINIVEFENRNFTNIIMSYEHTNIDTGEIDVYGKGINYEPTNEEKKKSVEDLLLHVIDTLCTNLNISFTNEEDPRKILPHLLIKFLKLKDDEAKAKGERPC